MPLSEYIKKELITCSPEQSVKEVADLMKKYEIGSVLITEDDGKPVGIITDRDIALRCVSTGIDPANVHAKNIMTRSIKAVNQNEGILDVLKCMKEARIRRVPLVDDEGKAVSLVSFGDMLELLVTELAYIAAPTKPEQTKIEKEVA